MDVIIHTYDRARIQQQATLKMLNDDGIRPTLVVQEREVERYGRSLGSAMTYSTFGLPDYIRTLAPTRDYIIHKMVGDDHVVFMDDDLHFAVRRGDDPTRFRNPAKGDLRKMLMEINLQLEKYPMVGIGAREGGNRVTEPFLHNTRIMRVLAFRRSYLQKHLLFFSPMVVMEDFHINLQVLRSGADTCVCNEWVSNQAQGSDAPGGCSAYRTDAVQSAAAHQLATLHPGFVRVVQKASNNWGKPGATRTDVIVQWKKARQSAPDYLP